MIQNIIVISIIVAAITYTIYTVVKSLNKKNASNCDDCAGCDVGREVTKRFKLNSKATATGCSDLKK